MVDPLMEWVDGNLLRARQFTVIDLVSLVVGALVPTVLLLASTTTLLGVTVASVGLAGAAITVAVLGGSIAGLAMSRIPRRWPVVKRLGISPIEIRLEYSFRKLKAPWTRVRWRDPVRIVVLQWGGEVQFLLTDSQADRIRHFFQQGKPLPSSTSSPRTNAGSLVVR